MKRYSLTAPDWLRPGQFIRRACSHAARRATASMTAILLGCGMAHHAVAEAVAAPPQKLQQQVESRESRSQFRILSYHDIRDDLRQTMSEWPESAAVDTQEFLRQISLLQETGHRFVSLEQIIAAQRGIAPLPEKAVLLTFDDGYKSLYTKVFPLLKQLQIPAVAALVGSWMDTPAGAMVAYGDTLRPRSVFVSWDEVREMVRSGLVEVASHSYDLHQGVTANPQGNQIPAAIARRYDATSGRYETDGEYEARISADLQRSVAAIARELQVSPRAMVWPYGADSEIANGLAAAAGMPVTMNLSPGPNHVEAGLSRLRRALITHDTTLENLLTTMRDTARPEDDPAPKERVIHVDLDYVYDPEPAVQEANLSALLDRMAHLRPTTVYLQAFADPDGDGVAESLYFPNRHLPVRSDLFTRVAWQLRTRVGVRVFAWMPVLAFKLAPGHPAADRTVQVMPGAPDAATQGRYHRLSLFDALARQTIRDIYEDLGKHAVFTGILFHDDATLSDYEDASPAALKVYREEWHLPASVDTIRQDSQLRRDWTRRKTAALTDFTVELKDVLRRYHPELRTARNLYAPVVLAPESEEWFAQSFRNALATYDYTAVMAMPYMEGADDAQAWLNRLIEAVRSVPDGMRKTVFELQARDWRNGQPIPGSRLAAQLRQLHLAGARSFGYYPDDFHRNQPDAAVIKPVISVEYHPERR